MNITFRQFRNQDADNIRTVALQSWRHTYKDIFSDTFIQHFVKENYSNQNLMKTLPNIESGNMFFEVALDKSRIIGFSNIGNGNKGWELFRIYLHPEYIGKGIGRKLLIHGETFLKSKGADKYFCCVIKDNKLGINFYNKNGFKHIPQKDNDEEWYMEKTLHV